VAVGRTYRFPPLLSGGASLDRPWLPFRHPAHRTGHADLRIRLSDKTSRLHPRHVVPKPAQADAPEVPVKVREWISPALASPDLVLEAQPHRCVVGLAPTGKAAPFLTAHTSSGHLLSAGKETFFPRAKFGPISTLAESRRDHTERQLSRLREEAELPLRSATDDDLVHILDQPGSFLDLEIADAAPITRCRHRRLWRQTRIRKQADRSTRKIVTPAVAK